MRISRALISLLTASAVGLAACGGEGGDELVSGVAETPVASSSASPSVSPSPDVRSVSFSPVDAGILGMDVAGAQEGDWPADSVPRFFAAWDEFVAAVVDRYAGRIRAHHIIKEGDPAALVVGASTTVRVTPVREFVEID